MYFLVDPIVLCLPEPDQNRPDQIEYFFKYLDSWSVFIREGEGHDNEFYMTEACSCKLSSRFLRLVDKKVIQRYLNQTDGTLDANAVFTACSRILTNFPSWPFFEQKVDLGELLVHTDTMSLDPDLVGRTPPEIAASFQETFGYVAYSKEIDENDIASDLYLLTHSVNDSSKIEIEVTVEDDKEEHEVTTDLPIVETPDDLLKHVRLIDIWENTEQAIDWAKKKCRLDNNTELFPYTVGPNFSQSLEKYNFPAKSNLLEQCFKKIARLLAGEKLSNTYSLTSEGGRSEQRRQTVDGNTWEAWRLRITEGGGAVYRLHYWKNENNYVFSNVVDHNDHSICNLNEDIVSKVKGP